jgi:hypothetical protein
MLWLLDITVWLEERFDSLDKTAELLSLTASDTMFSISEFRSSVKFLVISSMEPRSNEA